MEKELGSKLPVTWRYFSLEQVNSDLKEGERVWDTDRQLKGINAFRASEAVRKQGENLFIKFHELVLAARRQEFRDISDPEVLKDVAAKAGVDIHRYWKDFDDPASIDGLTRDHFFAVDELNVFGTPTFVVKGSEPVYLKIANPDLGDNLQFFRDLLHIVVGRPDVWEIKRP